jgi:hypothetical protein
MNFKIKSVQFFKITYRSRLYIYIFIKISTIFILFSKKIPARLISDISKDWRVNLITHSSLITTVAHNCSLLSPFPPLSALLRSRERAFESWERGAGCWRLCGDAKGGDGGRVLPLARDRGFGRRAGPLRAHRCPTRVAAPLHHARRRRR